MILYPKHQEGTRINIIPPIHGTPTVYSPVPDNTIARYPLRDVNDAGGGGRGYTGMRSMGDYVVDQLAGTVGNAADQVNRAFYAPFNTALAAAYGNPFTKEYYTNIADNASEILLDPAVERRRREEGDLNALGITEALGNLYLAGQGAAISAQTGEYLNSAINAGKRLFGRGAEAANGAVPLETMIDWAAWNKEIPKNEALMQEYLEIENAAKEAGTWMKNPDGSPFWGTPEQFVQIHSKNFEKAFPDFVRVYRGMSDAHPELTNNHAVFVTTKNNAKSYESRFKDPYESHAWGMEDDEAHAWDSWDAAEEAVEERAIDKLNERFLHELAMPVFPDSKYQTMNMYEGEGGFLPVGREGAWEDLLNTAATWGKEHQDRVLRMAGGNVEDKAYLIAKKAYEQDLLNQVKFAEDKAAGNLGGYDWLADVYTRLENQPYESVPSSLEPGYYHHDMPAIRSRDIAKEVKRQGLDWVQTKNVKDFDFSDPSDVWMYNHRAGRYLKSLIGNNGMFNMYDPNIYKAVTGAGALDLGVNAIGND